MTTDEKRGFAGLQSMVSRVDAKEVAAEPTVSHEDPTLVSEKPERHEIYQGKPESSTGSGKWWMVGVGVGVGLVILVIWISNIENKAPSRSPPPSYSVPANPKSPTLAYPIPDPAPTYGSTEEERPPAGSGMTFNRSQIRYCLSEKIRISAWQGALNKYSETSVNAYNAAVDDYNARCSNFRYKVGMLESVRAEVETNRSTLISQGIGKANSPW